MAGKASFASTALKGLALGAGTAAVGVGIAAVKMAGDFQTSMERIHTQANQSNKTVAALSKGVLAMAGSVASTPNTLATAAYHIASIGQHSLTTAQQLDVLKTATEGAKIGGADLVDVTNALDAAIVSHIKGVKNYSQAMGVLNSTVGAGDMTMQNLAEAFGPLGAVLKGYNVTIQQAGAALATFGDNNLRGAQAGTALRMAVQSLAVPTSNGAAQLQAWGIKAGNLSKQLQHGGLTSALDTLMAKMRANGVTAKDQGTILTEAFGKRAGIGLAVLMGQLDRYHGKLKEVTDGGNGFAKSWAGYTKTFGYALDSAKASAETLLIQLGTKLLPTVTKFTNWLAQVAIPDLSKFGAWLQKNSAWTKPLAIGIAAVGAALMVAFGGPLPAIVGLTAITVGLVEAYNHSKTFRNVVQGSIRGTITVFKALRSAGVAVWHALDAVWQGFADGPLAYVQQRVKSFSTFWHSHLQSIREVTAVVWRAISTAIKVEWQIAMGFLRPSLTVLKAIFKTAFDVAKNEVVGALRVISAVLKTFQNVVQDTVGLVLDLITGKWGKAWSDAKALVSDSIHGVENIIAAFVKGAGTLLLQAGKDIISGLINGIKSGIGAVKSTVSGIAGTIKHAFTHPLSIFSPSKVFHGYGVNIVQGLTNGVKSKIKDASDVARLLAEGMIGGWTGAAGRLKAAFSTGIQDALSNFTAKLTSALDKQQAALKTAQSNLKNFLKNRASSISSLQSSIAGNADISNVLNQTLTVGSVSVDYTGNIGSYLSSQAGLLKREAGMFGRLRKMGLSPKLLSQISSLAPSDAITVMQQILSGQDGSIASLNRSESLIQSYAKKTATRTIETPHDKEQLKAVRAGVHIAQQQLHEQEKTNRKLEHLAAQIIASKSTVVFNGSSFKVTDEKDLRRLIQELKKLERKGVKLH